MTTRLAALALLAGCGALHAQELAPPSDEEIERQIATGRAYTFVFLKTGSAPSPPPEELQRLQREHQRNLFAMKQEGLATLAGPFRDGGDLRGLVIFNTDDQALVRSRLDADPYVKAGLMVYELKPWFGIPGSGIRAQPSAPAGTVAVRAFVAAFNARDLDGMLALADDAIEWASVDGTRVAVETAGKEALRASMTSYFASCPSCRSTLEWVEQAGSRVTALERASWTNAKGEAKSQASLSVYELRDGRIARVYYFPAEP